MKICKIKLIKKLSGNRCDNIYPLGYNANNINIVAYDEYALSEGDNTGYCIGLVKDDFSFNTEMAEITKTDADIFIDDRADVEVLQEDKTQFATTRKQIITDAGII